MQKREIKKIGQCTNDAGLCFIGDPCYFWPKEYNDKGEEETFFFFLKQAFRRLLRKPLLKNMQPSLIRYVGTWSDLVEKFHGPSTSPESSPGVFCSFNDMGILFTTHGDWTFPVYGEFLDGHLASVTIRVDPENWEWEEEDMLFEGFEEDDKDEA